MSAANKQNELLWWQQQDQRILAGQVRVDWTVDLMKRCYRKLDTDRLVVLPFSLLAALLFTLIVATPVTIGLWLWGQFLRFMTNHPLLCMRAERFIDRALVRFAHLGYCMGLCILTHIMFIYFGWEQLIANLLEH